MKNVNFKSYLGIAVALFIAVGIVSFTNYSKSKKITVDYNNSEVSYYGSQNFGKEDLLKEAKLIDIADRRFEEKWKNKDAKGIGEEYTEDDSVFMKPGVEPKVGRVEIAKLFEENVKAVNVVKFYQHELQFYGDMDVAFQRCHMKGWQKGEKEHSFLASYVVLWKKVDGNWLLQYDMFNSDK